MSYRDSQQPGRLRSAGLGEPAGALDRDASQLALFCGLALLLVAALALLGADSASRPIANAAATPDRNLRAPVPVTRQASAEVAAVSAEGSLVQSVVALDGRGTRGTRTPVPE